ncbi:keratin, type II cytoskeletal 1-like [Mizuhopecten yessoensis]|uniref:keratin, type II cytoskeletal 1-like n=1 Tax=Mizuhopecten yessoensis TaxID=6573 RepID=UPI000B458B7B|nr:keratin, type II cytoskeletal 1-like [Mizuhopecten yessoensis]
MKLLVAVIAFVCLTELVLCQGNNLGLLAAGGLLGFAASRSGLFGGGNRGFFPGGGYGYGRFGPGGFGHGGFGPSYGPGYGFHRPYYG